MLVFPENEARLPKGNNVFRELAECFSGITSQRCFVFLEIPLFLGFGSAGSFCWTFVALLEGRTSQEKSWANIGRNGQTLRTKGVSSSGSHWLHHVAPILDADVSVHGWKCFMFGIYWLQGQVLTFFRTHLLSLNLFAYLFLGTFMKHQALRFLNETNNLFPRFHGCLFQGFKAKLGRTAFSTSCLTALGLWG